MKNILFGTEFKRILMTVIIAIFIACAIIAIDMRLRGVYSFANNTEDYKEFRYDPNIIYFSYEGSDKVYTSLMDKDGKIYYESYPLLKYDINEQADDINEKIDKILQILKNNRCHDPLR